MSPARCRHSPCRRRDRHSCPLQKARGSSWFAPAQAFPAVGASDRYAGHCRACRELGDPSSRKHGPARACPRVLPSLRAAVIRGLVPGPSSGPRGPSAVQPPRQRPSAPSHRVRSWHWASDASHCPDTAVRPPPTSAFSKGSVAWTLAGCQLYKHL